MKEELKVLGVSKFSQGCLVGLEPEEDSREVQNKVKSQMSLVKSWPSSVVMPGQITTRCLVSLTLPARKKKA